VPWSEFRIVSSHPHYPQVALQAALDGKIDTPTVGDLGK
jgi:hypothetical protein